MIVGARGTQSLFGVFLNQHRVYPSSPLAFLASLQTSNFQVPNRTTGAYMSPIKRSDVKNHFHYPLATKIHLVQPESQPDATGFSGSEPEIAKANPQGFSKDFFGDHSSSGVAVAPTQRVIESSRQQASAISKSVPK
jgi:hypothetical protein